MPANTRNEEEEEVVVEDLGNDAKPQPRRRTPRKALSSEPMSPQRPRRPGVTRAKSGDVSPSQGLAPLRRTGTDPSDAGDSHSPRKGRKPPQRPSKTKSDDGTANTSSRALPSRTNSGRALPGRTKPGKVSHTRSLPKRTGSGFSAV